MRNKMQFGILAVLGIVMLTACGSKTDANEKNFGVALTRYFDKKGGLCLDTKRWPVDLSEYEVRLQKTQAFSRGGQMAALEAAGLVKGEDIEVDVMDIMGKPTGRKRKVKRYTLTDAAKPFSQEQEVRTIGLNGLTTEKQTDLCWGKKSLDKVVKWEGPLKLGDYQEASVTYLYKVNNVAEWAKRPDVQASFPLIKSILDAAGTTPARHAVKLTSEGWEAKGLDR